MNYANRFGEKLIWELRCQDFRRKAWLWFMRERILYQDTDSVIVRAL